MAQPEPAHGATALRWGGDLSVVPRRPGNRPGGIRPDPPALAPLRAAHLCPADAGGPAAGPGLRLLPTERGADRLDPLLPYPPGLPDRAQLRSDAGGGGHRGHRRHDRDRHRRPGGARPLHGPGPRQPERPGGGVAAAAGGDLRRPGGAGDHPSGPQPGAAQRQQRQPAVCGGVAGGISGGPGRRTGRRGKDRRRLPGRPGRQCGAAGGAGEGAGDRGGSQPVHPGLLHRPGPDAGPAGVRPHHGGLAVCAAADRHPDRHQGAGRLVGRPLLRLRPRPDPDDVVALPAPGGRHPGRHLCGFPRRPARRAGAQRGAGPDGGHGQPGALAHGPGDPTAAPTATGAGAQRPGPPGTAWAGGAGADHQSSLGTGADRAGRLAGERQGPRARPADAAQGGDSRAERRRPAVASALWQRSAGPAAVAGGQRYRRRHSRSGP